MGESTELTEAKTKTIDGKPRPAGDFLVVEDSDKPSTWHLPVKVNGTPDHRLMGAAWAALHKGFRGNKYAGPDKAGATSRLKALYKSEGMETPMGELNILTEMRAMVDEYLAEVKGGLRDTARRIEDAFHAAYTPGEIWEGPYRTNEVFMAHPVLGDAIVITERDGGAKFAVGYTMDAGNIIFDPRAEWTQVELIYQPIPVTEMESTGLAVSSRDATESDLSEIDATVEEGRRAPVVIDFQVLQPGPGNKRDGHYYPADVVERDIHVFNGVDVFATDHNEKDRSERTKVGKVLGCPTTFTESKAPVAQVLIYDPDQAEKARNRADADALDTLECSILGSGRAKDGEIDGQKYKIVEAITNGRYLELVSKAGAGGKALNLAESAKESDSMDKEQENADATPVEEVQIEEAEADAEQEQEQPQVLGSEIVAEALKATNLPEFVKTILAEREYESDTTLKEAIDNATAEVKKLTGSGRPKELGESEKPQEQTLSLEEREKQSKEAFNAIMQEIGLKEV